MELAPTVPVPLATYSEGSPWRSATLEALNTAGRSYDFAYVSASYESLCSSVLAGFGITALPDWDMDGRFVILDGTCDLPPLPQVRTVLKTAATSPVLRQFCDFIMPRAMAAQSSGSSPRIRRVNSAASSGLALA